MKVKKSNNRIYFNDDERSFGNITLSNNIATIELIKVPPCFRGARFASQILKKIILYIKKELRGISKIELTPLPLSSDGLNIDQLIHFYEKYGFKRSNFTSSFNKYLMVRYL